MQKTLAVILLSFFSLTGFSQGRIEGGFYAGYFQLGERGFNEFGAMLHIPVGDVVTLNYHVGFGSSLNSGMYIHSPAGVVGGLWLLKELGPAGVRIGYVSLLFAVIPEGVGFYLPTRGKLSTHLSINPLGVEYFYRMRTGEEWGKLGCDVVARFKMHGVLGSHIYVAPQVAGTLIYTPGQMTSKYGVKAGVTIGFEGDSY